MFDTLNSLLTVFNGVVVLAWVFIGAIALHALYSEPKELTFEYDD